MGGGGEREQPNYFLLLSLLGNTLNTMRLISFYFSHLFEIYVGGWGGGGDGGYKLLNKVKLRQMKNAEKQEKQPC